MITRHDAQIDLANRTINGYPVAEAYIAEEGDIYQAVIIDDRGTDYISGSNARDLDAERRVLADMLDPIV